MDHHVIPEMAAKVSRVIAEHDMKASYNPPAKWLFRETRRTPIIFETVHQILLGTLAKGQFKSALEIPKAPSNAVSKKALFQFALTPTLTKPEHRCH